jgi:hypothetical protein
MGWLRECIKNRKEQRLACLGLACFRMRIEGKEIEKEWPEESNEKQVNSGLWKPR